MFGHPLELIVVLVLALIFFGPEKLPEVAATAGKFVRDLRESFDATMNPQETTLPDDFSTYYQESMQRAGEEPEVVDEPYVAGERYVVEDLPDPADDAVDYSHTGSADENVFHPDHMAAWDEHGPRDAYSGSVDPADEPPSETSEHDAVARLADS